MIFLRWPKSFSWKKGMLPSLSGNTLEGEVHIIPLMGPGWNTESTEVKEQYLRSLGFLFAKESDLHPDQVEGIFLLAEYWFAPLKPSKKSTNRVLRPSQHS